ncbi:unnamed protein product, partial [Amoebophrya sp. A25]
GARARSHKNNRKSGTQISSALLDSPENTNGKRRGRESPKTELKNKPSDSEQAVSSHLCSSSARGGAHQLPQSPLSSHHVQKNALG